MAYRISYKEHIIDLSLTVWGINYLVQKDGESLYGKCGFKDDKTAMAEAKVFIDSITNKCVCGNCTCKEV